MPEQSKPTYRHLGTVAKLSLRNGILYLLFHFKIYHTFVDRLFYLVCHIFLVTVKSKHKRFCGFVLFSPKGLKFFHSKLSIQWDFQELIMCKMLLVQDKDKNEAFKIASVTVRIKWPTNHQSKIQLHSTNALFPSSF